MVYKRESASELWAVVSGDGHVLRTRGGSSSTPRLMVYDSRAKAERALKSPWIKQVIDRDDVVTKLIYAAQGG